MNKFVKTVSVLSLCSVLVSSAYGTETLVLWEDYQKSAAIEQAIITFEKKNDCRIIVKEYSGVYQFGEYLNTDSKPDIFIIQSDKTQEAVNMGLIESLEFMDADGKGYSDLSVRPFEVKGKIYAAPRSIDSMVVFYNKDIMEKPFETFDEYIEFAKQRKKEGRYGLIGKFDQFYLAYGVIAGFGGYTFSLSEDGSYNENDIGLNNKGAVRALEFIRDYTDNYIPRSLLTNRGWDEMDNLFIERKAAAVISGPWSIKKYKKAGINYGISTLPLLSNGEHFIPYYGVKGYALSSESKHKELAKKFIRHLNHPVYAMARYVAIGELPPINDVINNPLIVNEDLANVVYEQTVLADPMPSIPRMAKVWDLMNTCLYQVITGKKSAQEAADEAVAKIKAD